MTHISVDFFLDGVIQIVVRSVEVKTNGDGDPETRTTSSDYTRLDTNLYNVYNRIQSNIWDLGVKGVVFFKKMCSLSMVSYLHVRCHLTVTWDSRLHSFIMM